MTTKMLGKIARLIELRGMDKFSFGQVTAGSENCYNNF